MMMRRMGGRKGVQRSKVMTERWKSRGKVMKSKWVEGRWR